MPIADDKIPTGNAASKIQTHPQIISGIVILSFLFIHFYDFWVHEMKVKYINGDMTGLDQVGEFRYWKELNLKFNGNIVILISYCFSFIALGLHLVHGFSSSIQSIGVGAKRFKIIRIISLAYSIIVPLGFKGDAVKDFLKIASPYIRRSVQTRDNLRPGVFTRKR